MMISISKKRKKAAQITKERRKKSEQKRNGLGKTNRASEKSRVKTIHQTKVRLERKQ